MSIEEELSETLNRLDESVHLERTTNDPERIYRLVHLGFILNEAKRMISSLQEEAKTILLDSDWDRGPIQAQQFSMETKTGAPRKKWNHQGLVEVVAQKITDTAIDMDTGEITKTPQQMIKELMEYAAPSYWRVQALRDLGIDADSYCDVGEPNTNLIYRSNENV
tara:strand:+ start:3257 stop:3751 length:495 start_codon:yes stop_codon:yes gene_type:complete